jgi:hypothetical protein
VTRKVYTTNSRQTPRVSASEQIWGFKQTKIGLLGKQKSTSSFLLRHKRILSSLLVRLEIAMLWTILVVLCVLWLLGIVASYTFGGFIHILLLAALAIFVINLIQGRRSAV